LIARAYNPSLSEEVNARRVSRLATAMRLSLQQKQRAAEYFQQNGTLQGFGGAASFSTEDFINALDDERLDTVSGEPAPATGAQAPQQAQPAPQAADDDLINKYLGGP